jgi:hypothetical protein
MTMAARFDLLMFSAADHVVRAAETHVDGFVVDWENKGKTERQNGYDTQINFDTPEDLRRVVAHTSSPVLCRVNNAGNPEETLAEIERAIGLGAREILLPMVRTPAEVERALRHVDGRLPLGILIETPEAVRESRALGRLPLARVYVGLNDLGVARGSKSIFEAVADGTVDKVRADIDVPFGFAGVTLPERGAPIPSALLINEFVRLGCSFTFLRRSFLADSAGVGIPEALRRIRLALDVAWNEASPRREALHDRLLDAIREHVEMRQPRAVST